MPVSNGLISHQRAADNSSKYTQGTVDHCSKEDNPANLSLSAKLLIGSNNWNDDEQFAEMSLFTFKIQQESSRDPKSILICLNSKSVGGGVTGLPKQLK